MIVFAWLQWSKFNIIGAICELIVKLVLRKLTLVILVTLLSFRVEN